jgi:hypothetical protein
MRKSRIAPALLLIMAMFALAEYGGEREIIFPEIAALALGAWIMENPPWSGAWRHFWLSPTLAALTGTLIVRYFSYAPLPMIAGAFCLVVLQLKLLRSGVLPSISAAILAILTRCDSWWYPLSVCVLTGVVGLGYRFLTVRAPGESSTASSPATCGENAATIGWSLAEFAHWAKLLAAVICVSAVAAGSGNLFMVAPPLIVALVELSKPGGTLGDRWGTILGLLVFAAFSGVFWFSLLHTTMAWSLWLSACVSALTVFFAYHRLRLPFPPAVAIALLPTIVPTGSLWSYPWQVTAGSAAFIAISRIFFRQQERSPAAEGSSTC